MRFVDFVLLIVITCFGCQSSSVGIDDLDWMQGTWQIEGKLIFEEWARVNAHLYRGKSYQIRKNDTLVTETIEIAQIGKELFYIPEVADQNDGKAVMFKLIFQDPEYLIFENKNHDFPQRIAYKKKGKNKMNAFIDGQSDDGYKKVEFPYVKVED